MTHHFVLTADAQGLKFQSPNGEALWSETPDVLGHLLVHLVAAQPSDVLHWLHEAVWQLHTGRKSDHTCSPLQSIVVSPSSARMQESLMKYVLPVDTGGSPRSPELVDSCTSNAAQHPSSPCQVANKRPSTVSIPEEHDLEIEEVPQELELQEVPRRASCTSHPSDLLDDEGQGNQDYEIEDLPGGDSEVVQQPPSPTRRNSAKARQFSSQENANGCSDKSPPVHGYSQEANWNTSPKHTADHPSDANMNRAVPLYDYSGGDGEAPDSPTFAESEQPATLRDKQRHPSQAAQLTKTWSRRSGGSISSGAEMFRSPSLIPQVGQVPIIGKPEESPDNSSEDLSSKQNKMDKDRSKTSSDDFTAVQSTNSATLDSSLLESTSSEKSKKLSVVRKKSLSLSAMKDLAASVVGKARSSLGVHQEGEVSPEEEPEEWDMDQPHNINVGLPSWYAPEIETEDKREDQPKTFTPMEATYSMEEERAGSKEKSKIRCVLSPVSRPRMTWDIMGLVMLSMEIWSVPFEIVFLPATLPPSFYWLSIAATVFFSCDIVLNCFTGYVSENILILDRKKILINYFTGWFWIDAVATVPINLMFQGAKSEADALSLVRISRGMKAMKMLRFLRMLKLLRLVRARAQAQRLQDNLLSSPKAQLALKPVLGFVILLVLSHFHACLFAAVTDLTIHMREGWLGDIGEQASPFEQYGFSFWWAYTKMTFGNMVKLQALEEQIYSCIITTEKLVLLSFLIHWVVNTALLFSQDKAERFLRKSTVVEYFKRHKLPYHLTLQVISSLEQTHDATSTLNNLEDLVWKGLPQSLRRVVADELWSKHLMSLGLTLHVARWHSDFVSELSMLVSEQVLASQAILFREGEPATSACLVLKGTVCIASSFQNFDIPPFTTGQWVGEKVLCSLQPMLRSATVRCREQSNFLVVPSEAFHELLKSMGLKEQFTELLNAQLRYGLCGRCGVLGDHFGDACPMLNTKRGQTSAWQQGLRVARLWIKTRAQKILAHTPKHKTHSVVPPRVSRQQRAELFRFLQSLDADDLMPVLQEHNVYGLENLRNCKKHELKLDAEQEHMFDRALGEIDKYQKKLDEEFQARLGVQKTEQTEHYMFLSHYKLESGTECSLIKEELEQILKENKEYSNKITNRCTSPVFLDSDDLFDLENLRQKVRNSHNFVLVLTEHVLSRPWVAAELVTAYLEGGNLLLVEIQRPGLSAFPYPDEGFYKRLRHKEILNDSAVDLLKDLNIDIQEVENAYRFAFKKIAVPFSPHKSGNIRRAELQDLLKRCEVREGA